MTLRGIDVSHHQDPGAINWHALAVRHRFVIARATYGTRPDRTCATHIECARGAGLVPGLYHFFRPGQSLAEQIAAFTDLADVLGMGPGWLLPTIDIENNETHDGPFTAARYVEPCWTFVEAMRQRYGGCLIYCNPSDWRALGSPEWLQENHLWLAQWNSPRVTPPFGMPVAIHQHKVAPLPGIYEGLIDQNVAEGPLPLIAGEPLADWDDEEETTAVTRAELARSARELREAVDLLELPRDRDAETAARDRLVSESDDA